MYNYYFFVVLDLLFLVVFWSYGMFHLSDLCWDIFVTYITLNMGVLIRKVLVFSLYLQLVR